MIMHENLLSPLQDVLCLVYCNKMQDENLEPLKYPHANWTLTISIYKNLSISDHLFLFFYHIFLCKKNINKWGRQYEIIKNLTYKSRKNHSNRKYRWNIPYDLYKNGPSKIARNYLKIWIDTICLNRPRHFRYLSTPTNFAWFIRKYFVLFESCTSTKTRSDDYFQPPNILKQLNRRNISLLSDDSNKKW